MKSLILALVISMSVLNQSQAPSWLCDYKLIEKITPYTAEFDTRRNPERIISIEENLSRCALGPCGQARAFSQDEFTFYILDIAREAEGRRTKGSLFEEQKKRIAAEFETHSRGEMNARTAVIPNANIGLIGGDRRFTQLSKNKVACGTWETYRKIPPY
jgi:hypothetical protein